MFYRDTDAEKRCQELMTLLREKEDLARILAQRQSDFVDQPFCAHLGRMMAERGLTAAQLSQICLLSRSFTYQLCSGVRQPSRDMVVRLALAMGLDLPATQVLLRSAQRGELFPLVRRDAVLIHCVFRGRTLADTDDILRQQGETPLL